MHKKKAITHKDPVLIAETFEKFSALYPDSESQWVGLYKLIGNAACSCRECGEQIDPGTERSVVCNDCSHRNWITAGTFFEKILRPDVWLAVFFFKEEGVAVSLNQLRILLKASLDCVRNADLKIMMAFENFLRNKKEPSSSSGSLACSDLMEVLFRRSLETAAWTGAADESNDYPKIACDDEDEPQPQILSITIAPMSKEEEFSQTYSDEITKVLSAVSRQSSTVEQLLETTGLSLPQLNASLGMLEIAGEVVQRQDRSFSLKSKAEQSKKPVKDGQKRAPRDPSLKAHVEDFIEFAEQCWRGVSRKYAQLYFLSFWYRANRFKFPPGCFVSAVAANGHISSEEVRDYVSPSLLFFDTW